MLTSLTLSISLTIRSRLLTPLSSLNFFSFVTPLRWSISRGLFYTVTPHDNHLLAGSVTKCSNQPSSPARHPSRSETRPTNTGVAAGSCSLVPINSARLADL